MLCFYDLFLVVGMLCSWIVLYAWAAREGRNPGLTVQLEPGLMVTVKGGDHQ